MLTASPARRRKVAPSRDGLSAARKRRYRQHLKRHEMVADVVVGMDVLDLLIKLRWLAEADAHDRRLVGAAISRMLCDAAMRR